MDKLLNGFELMADLKTHAANNVWEFGVVKEDPTVLAFGFVNNGKKVRVGSISNLVEGEILILSYPNSDEEYKVSTTVEAGWFLWALDLHKGDWDKATIWIHE